MRTWIARAPLFTLLSVFATGCFATAPPLPEHLATDRVRVILNPNCGSCHRSDLETAKPDALAIYDLMEDLWAARMTEDQLYLARKQLGSFGTDDPEELAVFDQFIIHELERRRTLSPTLPP